MKHSLKNYIGAYKRVTVLTPILTALEVLMEVLIPFVVASLIDKGIEAGSLRDVYLYGAIMLVIAFLSLLFGILAGRFGAEASAGFAGNLRDAMYDSIQTFSFSNIEKFSTAGLVTRMTTDVSNVQMAFQMSLRIAVRTPFMLICSMVMCFVISARLSLIFLAAIAVLGAALFFIMRKAVKLFDEVFDKYDDLNSSVQENVSAIRVVKAFVREDHETQKFTHAAENLCRLFIRSESLLALNNPIMMLVTYACIIAISWFGAHMIVVGDLTTGNLTSLFSYVMSILMSMMMLSMIFVMLTMSAASARRIAEVLDEEPDLTDPVHPCYRVKDGSIDFDHVSFSYKAGSGEETLHDVDLHIRSGETIGVIGGTGCGKSSLAGLISRLYDVQAGTVRVGGRDVREYELETLRNEVAVVLQKNVLFSGTILDNLRWGDENASEEECVRMAKLACADEFIQRFPDKYNTWIEQGGTNVSGGQKQRLCIARALLRKPKILILDDSTSAVDTATDASIRRAFREEIPGTTKIIIAQRISSVQDADRILVLDNGQVNGLGTHEELLASNAIYQEVYHSQTQGGGDFDKQGGEQ